MVYFRGGGSGTKNVPLLCVCSCLSFLSLVRVLFFHCFLCVIPSSLSFAFSPRSACNRRHTLCTARRPASAAFPLPMSTRPPGASPSRIALLLHHLNKYQNQKWRRFSRRLRAPVDTPFRPHHISFQHSPLLHATPALDPALSAVPVSLFNIKKISMASSACFILPPPFLKRIPTHAPATLLPARPFLPHDPASPEHPISPQSRTSLTPPLAFSALLHGTLPSPFAPPAPQQRFVTFL